MAKGRQVVSARQRRVGAPRATFGLMTLLALLTCALAGCDISQISLAFGGVAPQRCVGQQQGALGPDGGVIVPLGARDPTATYHTTGLYAIRADDGALAWSCASTTYAGWNDVQLVNGVIYALAGTEQTKDASAPTHVHAIYAIRPQDGKQLWSYSLEAGTTSALAFDGGMLFVSSVTADTTSSHSDLYALHARDGSLAWMESFADTIGQPLIVAHHVIVPVGAPTGYEFRALSESNGSALWSTPLPGNTAPNTTRTLNGVIYLVSGATLAAIDGATGALRWTQQTPDSIVSPLYAGPGDILLATTQTVFAYDAASGALRWSAVLGAQPLLVAMTTQMAHVIIQGPSGQQARLYALDTGTGKLVWQRDMTTLTAVTTDATTGSATGTYLLAPTGKQSLTTLVALDQRGGARWRFSSQSPYNSGTVIATGGLIYYIWQARQAGVSVNAPDVTSVTCLRASDGAALWTTPLPALDADPLTALTAT